MIATAQAYVGAKSAPIVLPSVDQSQWRERVCGCYPRRSRRFPSTRVWQTHLRSPGIEPLPTPARCWLTLLFLCFGQGAKLGIRQMHLYSCHALYFVGANVNDLRA